MKKYSVFMAGILGFLLVFGFVLTACDTGGGDDGGGNTTGDDDTVASSYTFTVTDTGIYYGITIRDTTITADITGGMEGFTVKADGTVQTLAGAYAYADSPNKAYVNFGDGTSLTTSSVVTISYDGTGPFAGQLTPFTDQVCEWESKK
jgi:hypothetical protein